MEKYAVFRRIAAVRVKPLAALFLALAIINVSIALPDAQAGTQKSFWKHRDQYVRLEPQDRGEQPTEQNAHPVTLKPELIRDMLGTLEINYPGRDKREPLFTFAELNILQDAVSQALAAATPKEDVAFAIVGIHRGLVSFSHDRSVTTGRIFFSQGKLNLILGRLHEDYDEEEDRRMHPFLPGSRKYKAPRSWEPAEPWGVSQQAGVETKKQGDIERYNWLILDPNPKLWQAVRAEKQAAKETAKAAFQEASQVRQESAQVSAEQERLRAELEALKQDMKSMKQAPSAAPAIVQPAQTEATDSIKIRLRRLKDLRDEELISEDEYQAKRQEILDNL
ncbi:MAG: hypothetical protein AB7D06_08330 [Pedobacter sp.]